MNRRSGILCIALGLICLAASVGITIYNTLSEKNAQQAADSMLHTVQQQIAYAEENTQPLSTEMAVTQVNGYDCIGILSIPVLEVELPVLTDWSYEKLKVAPCLYYGNYFEPDFVIAAHNYRSHFGRLSSLVPGDIITFTDVTGNVYYYEVVLLETLAETATEEMITSGFDLSLYTCTPGGGSRVTVRCNKVKK